MNIRSDTGLPTATREWGWKFHLLGVPTDRVMPGERYLSRYKFFVSGFDSSPFGIEWMRFEKDSPVHPLIREVPHLAFVVEDLEEELTKREFTVIGEPGEPSEGIRTAMIEYEGAPVELMEFKK